MPQFLVDAQLPAALARWLEAQGHRAEHVADVGLQSASDAAVWDYATSTGAVIVTKDRDFALRSVLDSSGPAIVWVRRGNSRRQELFAWFGPLLPYVLEGLARGERLIEVI